jgi:hypothetical protein
MKARTQEQWKETSPSYRQVKTLSALLLLLYKRKEEEEERVV